MNRDLKDILSNSNKDIDNQRLMDYLTNQLSKGESHDVEKTMADDAFLNDAIEGLQKIENKKDVKEYLDQLNADLQKQTAKIKTRKEKRKLKDQPYTYFTIILILVLLVLSFFVIRKYIEERKNSVSAAPKVTMVLPK